VDQICKELAQNDYKFSSLETDIVKSDTFQMRIGRGAKQ